MGRGIYAPGEVARVSQARFVQLSTVGQVRAVGRYFICILGGLVAGVGALKVKQGVNPDSCQGNKFLLGLMVAKPALWCQAGSGEVANHCGPHV